MMGYTETSVYPIVRAVQKLQVLLPLLLNRN